MKSVTSLKRVRVPPKSVGGGGGGGVNIVMTAELSYLTFVSFPTDESRYMLALLDG